MLAGNTKTYAIHPAIGIARLGNADVDLADPSSYYLGPEAPFQVANQGRAYKAGGRIKKQAQRFRIYEFENGKAVREVTLMEDDVQSIIWTVHMANRKAALVDTDTIVGSSDYGPAKTRNAGATDRGALCIDPGPQSIDAPTATPKALTGSIRFPGGPTEQVTIGSLHIEPKTGRLLVFAGDGISKGLDDGQFSSLAELKQYANNDNWYDDTGDGRVTAEVHFSDGTKVMLQQPEQAAWVIGAVPRFAPGLLYFTTLFDVAKNAVSPQPGGRPSFARDIYPILRSISQLQWVNARGLQGHGSETAGYCLSEQRMRNLADNNPDKSSDPYKVRAGVFSKVRIPGAAVGGPTVMPAVPREVARNSDHEDFDIASVTELQYAMLKMWREGDFVSDAQHLGKFIPLEELALSDQPAALDLAALEGSAGTPFYPGIESWRITRQAALYAALLRISAQVAPGDLGIGNALPWQADFLDCNDAWWPIHRPSQVTRDGQPLVPWVDPEWVVDDAAGGYSKMVQNWYHLGFITSQDNGASYAETEASQAESPS